VLDRRAYAIHTLYKALKYVHGYLKDYDIVGRVDKSQLNPRLEIEVRIDSELPFHLRSILLEHVYNIAELLVEAEGYEDVEVELVRSGEKAEEKAET